MVARNKAPALQTCDGTGASAVFQTSSPPASDVTTSRTDDWVLVSSPENVHAYGKVTPPGVLKATVLVVGVARAWRAYEVEGSEGRVTPTYELKRTGRSVVSAGPGMEKICAE